MRMAGRLEESSRVLSSGGGGGGFGVGGTVRQRQHVLQFQERAEGGNGEAEALYGICLAFPTLVTS